MKRNRIVIDLNQPQTRQRSMAVSAGVRRVLIALALALIVIVAAVFAGGFIWWRSFQSSPAYSLAVLTDGAQREDIPTVDTVLDSEKVTNDFILQARQRTASTVINSLLSNQANPASALPPNVKQMVHDQVVGEIQRLTEPAAGKPFILIALAAPRFVQIERDNGTARALINIKDEHVRLTMQAAGNRWRVVAIQDDRLAQLIADGIRRNLATSGAQIENELHKRVGKLK
jgi:hypothetical protein